MTGYVMLHWARANFKLLKHTLVVWDLFAAHHDDRHASIPVLDYMVSQYEVAVDVGPGYGVAHLSVCVCVSV